MQRSGSDIVPDSSVVVVEGRFSARYMRLTWPKLLMLWEQLKAYRMLFSDLTRGDLKNFIGYVTSQDTLWLEIWRDKELVGIVTLERMHQIVDADAHVLFLESHPTLTDKIPVCKAIIAWIFASFPLQRLTVEVPSVYRATGRFVKKLGFRQEGKKRQAILIDRHWIDVYIFGLTRAEAQGK